MRYFNLIRKNEKIEIKMSAFYYPSKFLSQWFNTDAHGLNINAPELFSTIGGNIMKKNGLERFLYNNRGQTIFLT